MNFADHIVHGLAPDTDAFAGATVNSDVIDAAGSGVLFIIYKGVGTTGTSTVTVEACDDITPTTTAAVPFTYRTNTATDVWSAWTAATAAGFVTTAGSNHIYQVWVDPAELAEEGYRYVRLDMAEEADGAVLGGILAIVLDPRYQVQPTSLID